MALKIQIKGNFLVGTDSTTDAEYFRINQAYVRYSRDEDDNFSFIDERSGVSLSIEISAGLRYKKIQTLIPFADIVDFNGAAFASADAFETWISTNTGKLFSDGVITIDLSNVVFVSERSDLPTPSGGVITLVDEFTYWFTGHVDLLGDRLVCGDNTTILGSSSENCSITSTGLSASVALITTVYTMPMRHITIKDAGTALDIDGTGSVAAYDWTGVNFENVPTIGTIQNVSNFIFSKGAFLNSKGLTFDGTVNTIAFENSLLQSDGLTGSVISVLSTATINVRFRVTDSSIIVTALSSGINVSTSASVPVEGYILDTVNFSGGATYIVGVQSDDNKALFLKCRGIVNSAEISQYYMNGNATTTVVAGISTPVKVLGTTTSSSVTQKFTNTNNRATYTGALTNTFQCSATLSVTSGNNNQVGSYFAKNGALIPESEVYITTNGTGRFESCTIHTLVELSTNDYIEVWVENNTGANNILVTDLNTIIR